MEVESNLINAYLTAYNIACEKLKDMKLDEISINSNAKIDEKSNSIFLNYMNNNYKITLCDGSITTEDPHLPITTPEKVLMLHYIINSKIKPISGKLISFKEIPGGGAIYYSTFYKRAISPLVKVFASDFEGFYKAALALGGIKESYGHASITLNIFPLVPVTYVLWAGDEEIPASGTILFDDTITNYLPGEDIVLAASYGVYELIKHKS